MSEAAALCLIWLFQFGPNDHHLLNWLRSADAVEQRLLPLAELQEDWQPLWLVMHRRSDFPAAYFLGPTEAADFRAGLLFGTRRSLPGRQVPRFFLHAGLWQNEDLNQGLRPLETMALDDVEKIFRGFMGFYLARRLEASDTLRKELAARADQLMADVPEPYRHQAYVGAMQELGAHLLSIAHEIGRHQRRKDAAELCALLDHPATLFGFWQKAFTEMVFSGLYPQVDPDSGGARRRPWRRSRLGLSPDDKRWLAQEILGTDWTGTARQDFSFLCGP